MSNPNEIHAEEINNKYGTSLMCFSNGDVVPYVVTVNKTEGYVIIVKEDDNGDMILDETGEGLKDFKIHLDNFQVKTDDGDLIDDLSW